MEWQWVRSDFVSSASEEGWRSPYAPTTIVKNCSGKHYDLLARNKTNVQLKRVKLVELDNVANAKQPS